MRRESTEEREAQRLSFAFGNTQISNPWVTRDLVRKAALKLAEQRKEQSSERRRSWRPLVSLKELLKRLSTRFATKK